jgi:transposase InsO family protein
MSGDYRNLIRDLKWYSRLAAPRCTETTRSPNRCGHRSNRDVVHPLPTRADARRAIFASMNRYNHHRLHSSLGDVPPVECEQLYRQHHNDAE